MEAKNNMPSTFSLAPSPKWYFLDVFGRPAAGGTLTTWKSDDHSTPKFVFSDAAGLHPYTDPIELDATGGTPVPIYWEFNGVDLYYIQVKDRAGNLIFDLDNFPIIGGGGSTPITTNLDIENHLINGAFLFIDASTTADSIISDIVNIDQRVAPASGFFKSLTGDYLPSIPNDNSGWRYKGSGGAGQTASVQFVDVTNIGEGFPNAPSANATRFFRYQLSAAGAIQTAEQFYQVIPNVEAFSGEVLTITLDIHSNAIGVGSITILQNFGTGGTPSASVTTGQPLNFAGGGTWSRVTISITVPSVVGKIKGTNGDDSIHFICNFPLNTLGTFDVTNFQLQRGSFGLMPYIYQDYNQDQYKVLLDLITFGNLVFKTGELKWMSNAPGGSPIDIPGWLPLVDVNLFYLGSSASGAVYKGNQYKNLFIAWWNSFPQSECIVSGGRGVSALADFNANKGITIPRHILATALVGAGDSLFINAPFGFFEGEREHLLTIPEMPSHTHQALVGLTDAVLTAAGDDNFRVNDSVITTSATGGSLPHNNMQPTFYLWIYVKL
jgi:hypothetical protein